jgi:ribosomal protein L32
VARKQNKIISYYETLQSGDYRTVIKMKSFLSILRIATNRTTVTYAYPWASFLNSAIDLLQENIAEKLRQWRVALLHQPSLTETQTVFEYNDAVRISLDDSNALLFDLSYEESTPFRDDTIDVFVPSPIIYMAVPKSKVTRSKKRMKTTVQKRIPLKHNIVIDSRTGEVTLRHKLPFNWKNYLPDISTTDNDNSSQTLKETKNE